MMIFIREKLVFFSTPKTGSTSIEQALGRFCEIRISKLPAAKHTPVRKYKRLLEPFVLTLTQTPPDTVAAFRDPLDWLGSWYRYRSRAEIRGTKNSTYGKSFDQFVEGYLQEEQPDYSSVGSQAKFVSDSQGRIGISHLFPYERLDMLSAFLENRLRRKLTLKRLNTSPKAELKLSPALLSRLEQQYPRDFEIHAALIKDVDSQGQAARF